MIADVITVPYGRAATEALAGAVARAKAQSPLAPVTVVVPSTLEAFASTLPVLAPLSSATVTDSSASVTWSSTAVTLIVSVEVSSVPDPSVTVYVTAGNAPL